MDNVPSGGQRGDRSSIARSRVPWSESGSCSIIRRSIFGHDRPFPVGAGPLRPANAGHQSCAQWRPGRFGDLKPASWQDGQRPQTVDQLFAYSSHDPARRSAGWSWR